MGKIKMLNKLENNCLTFAFTTPNNEALLCLLKYLNIGL